jgi:disabled homolog 2
MNSCDEEYDEEYERRQHAASQRARGFKGNVHRSREILNSGENPNWRYPNEQWSDDEDDERIQDRSRQFDRNALRSTYGPPYDKREPKSLPYDRRVHDKRSKYYRPNRNEPYEYDPYDVPPPSGRGKSRKEFDDYEPGAFERGSRESRSAREFFYDRDRKSFDSNESYESGGRGGHRMGSGEIYGSYESRGEYRDRERYFAGQSRPRRSHRSRGELNDEDSEEEQGQRRITESTGSLQRPGGSSRTSKHIQLDDDIWGVGPKQQWKRPSSADRLSGSGGLSGSEDNESEKRHRRKTRPPKGKEVELRSNYATIRHPSHHQQRREYFEYDEESAAGFEDEPPRNISPRSQEHEYYGRRKPPHGPSQRNFSSTRSDSKGFNEYSKPRYPDDEEYDARKRGQGPFKKSSSRDLYVDDSRGGDYYQKPGFDDDEPTNVRRQSNKRMDYGEEFQQAQQQQQQQRPPSGQSQGGNNKFNFDGFESDFIASPKQADQQKTGSQQKFSFDSELSPSPNLNKNSSSQQRLRFSENVSVSKFDSNSSSQQMFEDDFAEWTADTPQASSNIQSSLKKGNSSNLKNNSFFARHENLKKSDSVNIFARKNDEDPFENDDFFASEGKNQPNTGEQDPFQWSNKNNFANFDDNKNI